MTGIIEIDGSYGEGGGAILRQALGLAAYAGRDLRVTKIRAGREAPGLKPQHLTAVKAAAAVCGGRVEGAEPGSTEIVFRPGRVRGGSFEFDIGTAGSVTLLLQTLLVPCLCSGPQSLELELVGGTDVKWSPPAYYLSRVTFAALDAFGETHASVERRGYYPKGGGRLRVRLAGGERLPDRLELEGPARFREVRGISHASQALAEREVAERQARAAEAELEHLDVAVAIDLEYADSYSTGTGITLWTAGVDGAPLGGSALGERGKPAEEVGRDAARALLKEIESGAAVDRYLADQLVPFLAVVGGTLRTSEITLHTRSNIYAAERLLDAEFEIDGPRVIART